VWPQGAQQFAQTERPLSLGCALHPPFSLCVLQKVSLSPSFSPLSLSQTHTRTLSKVLSLSLSRPPRRPSSLLYAGTAVQLSTAA